MNTSMRIRQLINAKGWSPYRLAIESNLSKSIIADILKRNSVPSISTLSAICTALGITLSQFFQEEGNNNGLSADQMDLFNQWMILSSKQNHPVNGLNKNME